MKGRSSGETIRSLLEKDIERALSPAIKVFQEKGKAPVERGSIDPT